MLKNLLLSVLLVFTSTSAYRQGQTYGSTYQPQEVQYRGIGYGSQRSYSQPYSGTYRPFSGAEPMRVDGTWTQPSYGGSSRPDGGIRKVRGYTADGDSINTDNDGTRGNPDDMWQDGYEYYYYNGHWYRKGSNGVWQEWSSLLNWDLFGFDWRRRDPGGTPTQYYENNPTPIGSPLTMALPACIYALYEFTRRRKRRK